MAGICGGRYFFVFFGLSSVLAFSQNHLKQTSAENCVFQVEPDRFLAREGRARREVNERVLKMSTAFSRDASVRAASADSIPQRNIVDQEIFGKLIKAGVPSAQLSSDAEFVRRIYLDLIGRIPSSDDV